MCEVELEFIEGMGDVLLWVCFWVLVIDGLFGIGLMCLFGLVLWFIIEYINSLCCLVLFIDVFSGLNVDIGSIVGGCEGVVV